MFKTNTEQYVASPSTKLVQIYEMSRFQEVSIQTFKCIYTSM